MDNAQWLLTIALVVGLAGTVLPLVPGLGLMFGALLVYSYFDGWQTFPIWYVLIVAAVAAAGVVIDHVASAMGAKRFGVSQKGFWGALLGGVIGGLLFSLVGLILGAVLGTVAVELYQQRTLKQSFSAATGVLVGTAVGMAAQFTLGLIVLISSILKMVL